MSNPFEIPLQRLQLTIERIRPQLVHAIGVEGLKFIDDNFAAQGFRGPSFQPWAKRKDNKRPGGAILVQTGALRRSFRQEEHEDSTTLFTDVPYARVHNEGARGPVYVRSRMGTFGKTFTRNMNTPQRRFMGSSPVLTRACEQIIIKKVTAALNA